jgi:hypothetical protein
LWLSYFERVLIKGSNRRSSAIVLEELVEMRAEATATTRYHFVTLKWARQWPCEEVCKVRRDAVPFAA